MRDESYAPLSMTKKWQQRWKDSQVFVTRLDPEKPKYYCFEFPPFPSGSLHMGHVRNYVIGDAIARYKRLRGYNVLHVQGFDSLGLPVEDAAIKAGMTPNDWVEQCILHMQEDLMQLGLSYDHTNFVSYHDPEYYRWTQWLFLSLYKTGWAYRAEVWTGWCNECRTAVAAELAQENRCWRCNTPVIMKQLPQWYVDVKRIAPELITGLAAICFPESARASQENWIGAKPGYFITVAVDGIGQTIELFTTTIELLYGATFLAMAPEHPRLHSLFGDACDDEKLLNAAARMCVRPRLERLQGTEIEGLFTGRYGIHPLTGSRLPIYIAPFVLAEFGTGVVFGCPAHGKTDFLFAKAMNLPSIQVVAPVSQDGVMDDQPYLGDGTLINSGPVNGLSCKEAAQAIAAELVRKGAARRGVTYSVKDWCISRQRYWSVPIPIIYCEACGTVPVRESDLPVVLPLENIDLQSPGNPLENSDTFVHCQCPKCGGDARRETSTLDTFVNSSWAYFRYCNMKRTPALLDPESVAYWMPADIGIGGTEQINVGNFYFRVVVNLLKKIGVTNGGEPWNDFLFHGLVMKDGTKMSKSLGNTVEPPAIIEKYGVDALRFHTLASAKPENDVNWTEETMVDNHRFLVKVWNLANGICAAVGDMTIGDMTERGVDSASLTTRRQQVFAHYVEVAAERATKGYEAYQLQRVCVNCRIFAEKLERFWLHARGHLSPANASLLRKGLKQLIVMMNPIVPHMTEELWERFGSQEMLCEKSPWEIVTVEARH